MTTKSEFSIVGLVHKFGLAWEKAGGTAHDLNRLAQDHEKLRQVITLIGGTVTHLVNVDAAPLVPNKWSVEVHRKNGRMEDGILDLGRMKMSLFLAEEQKESAISGNDLRNVMVGQPALNANVLDYLLANPELIPKEWKGKKVYFWGTIYRDRRDDRFVRYLRRDGDMWNWEYSWLGHGWFSNDPAAIIGT
jgi:hypothetical protein